MTLLFLQPSQIYELFYFFLNFLVVLAFAFGFALAAARWGAAFLTKRLNGR